MKNASTFDPKWTSPPGATAVDLMRERGLPVEELAQGVKKDLRNISRLLSGVEPLTAEWAESLSQVLGSTPRFWLMREKLYRADLKRLCDSTASHLTKDWLGTLPLHDMVRFGWIEEGSCSYETAINACAFFGTASPQAFESKYRTILSGSAYRASTAFETRMSAVAAWLRQGEIEALAKDCNNWNDKKLRDSLDTIRSLTKEPDPSLFLPRLEQVLANCGVAMVIARAPDGCRASGATRFLRAEKALIQLSFRYLADDQFWFTVFHEIGHLLLHTHQELFLEGLDSRNAKAEIEADEFALNTLFAKVDVMSLDEIGTSKFDIARLARKAGISPGIVVGQLQKRGRIPYKHFNFMKARYSWGDREG